MMLIGIFFILVENEVGILSEHRGFNLKYAGYFTFLATMHWQLDTI